jgi:hypothetical protein
VIEAVPTLPTRSVAPLLLHDTGVSPTRTRRQFTATYTLQILDARSRAETGRRAGAPAREGAERAELIIDAPQKFSQLLGLTLPPHDMPTATP